MKWKSLIIEISETGSIRFMGKTLRQLSSKRGYQAVVIHVHRAVALAFHGPPPEAEKRYVVHHIDKNPRNNHATNLQWLTHAEHLRLRHRKQRKLTTKQIAEIILLAPQSTITLTELAKSCGITAGTARAIRSGRLHKNGYSKTNATRITAAQLKRIRAWHPPSLSAAEVARMYKVSAATILNLWKMAATLESPT